MCFIYIFLYPYGLLSEIKDVFIIIRNMLTDNACSQLIHALVTVRIDYCNSLLYGLPDCSLSRLQRILNTAARILCKIPKFDQITKTLFDLQGSLSSNVFSLKYSS